ncbi:MAG: HEPN domain-containing protein [Desulfobacterales bacterium]|nr:HEPN domain-containing protein [Desulfobacterales bacterium]
MSVEKDRHEAGRWLQTAREDLDAAHALLEKGFYSHACFLAQQAAEKAVKALWYSIGEDPWGHSVQKLASEIPEASLRECMSGLGETGSFLDRFYIPTRYPNGLPDLTPAKVYFKQDAEQALSAAKDFLTNSSRCMEGFPRSS